MPFRQKYFISTQYVGAIFGAKRASAAHVHDWARLDVCETGVHNGFAEAS
jgi:hypothetical protein